MICDRMVVWYLMSGIRGPLVGRCGRGHPVIMSVVSSGQEEISDCAPLRPHRLQRRILGLPLRWLCI
jgi:hypothetical protein